MRHILRKSIVIILILAAGLANGQVTQLSDNTNIRYGVPLGDIGLMVDENGALWRTDGTPGGTMIYTSKVVKDTSRAAVQFNNKIYFGGVTLNEGSELWVTDGTDAGTTLIKDINTGADGSWPKSMFVFNNTIYFYAKTATAGYELWKSDGTSGGTVMVKDINPGGDNSFNTNYTFFVANNNVLFFDANDGSHGTELWKTDGTSGGTVMVKDIYPGSGSSNCQELTPLGNNIIFSADDGSHGVEPWKSDGSTTQMVDDIVSGNGNSNPAQFVPFQNKLFFITKTGGASFVKMYSTDGNTVTLVHNFGSGSFVFLVLSVVINNNLLFTAFAPLTGLELWSSNGTTAQIFKDINPGGDGSNAFILPDIFGAAFDQNNGDFHTRLYHGSQIFFVADDGTNGTELWITDGTIANTKMVTDINPVGSSMEQLYPYVYTTTDFYFSANNGPSGYELFKTDGTAGNTALVKDINPGNPGSFPDIFMFAGGHIYFIADDGDNVNGDVDLYKVDASVSLLPVTLLNFTAALNGKTVELNWSTANETNTKNFVVQRSYDGAHFDNIGSVNAAGNSTREINYRYTDASALNGSSKIYYRLQVVDNDGRFTYSKIALVTVLSDGNVVVVYPNPVKDQLIVVTSGTISKAEIRITDQSGKLVYQKQFENIQGGALNKINVAGLAKGVYYLQFITEGSKQTTKFIKQ